MIVHAIQLCSGCSAEQNLEKVKRMIAELPVSRPALVCLPESWLCFTNKPEQVLAVANNHQLYRRTLSELCKEHDIWLSAGTIPIINEHNKMRYYSASLLIDNNGQEQAHYHKIHLFDVQVSDSTGQYQESKHTEYGTQVCVSNSPFGRLGLSVCYDMRFSELYREQVKQGAQVLLIPSAFTVPTGRAHWHTLLKARAIESQTYVIAAGLYGRENSEFRHECGRETYGHSVIISPWGEVLSECPQGEGLISHTLNLNEVNQCRERMPMQAHRTARKVNL